MIDALIFASEPSDEFLTNPLFWFSNLGLAGVFLFLFAYGKIYPDKALEKVERQADLVITKLEDQLERVRTERDRALSERDQMIQVMTEFTQLSSIILNLEPPRRYSTRQVGESDVT